MAMLGNFFVGIVKGVFYRCPSALVRGHSIQCSGFSDLYCTDQIPPFALLVTSRPHPGA